VRWAAALWRNCSAAPDRREAAYQCWPPLLPFFGCRLRSQLGGELMERHSEALEMLEQMHSKLRPEVKASD
jgi:hypothetical protein